MSNAQKYLFAKGLIRKMTDSWIGQLLPTYGMIRPG